MEKKLKKAIRLYRQRGSRYILRQSFYHFEEVGFQLRRAARRFRFHRNGATVRYLDQEFELHPSGKGLSEEMVLYGSHEPVATEVYLQHLRKGDHILDVGSNLGYYLLLAAREVGDSGMLLGFEPARDVYAALERNVARSGRANIRVFPWAIGAQDGTTEFYESEIPNWGSMMQKDTLKQSRPITVPARTLDSLLDEFPGFHPNVLRMDVEGGELMVLQGAQQLLRKYKPFLFVEFHNFASGWAPNRKAILELRELGYTSGTLIDRDWDLPWISRWARERQCWSQPVDDLIRIIESRYDALESTVFSLTLKAA